MAQGTDLKGKSVENTYENLLGVDNPSFDGVDGELRHLQDTRGTRIPIQVQETNDGKAIVNITGVFQVQGTEFSISQEQIDAINALTTGAYIEVDGGKFE